IKAATEQSLKRIVYLGGLVNQTKNPLSDHFQTRLYTETKIMESPITAICFRASVILGPGSASFDLVRSLVTRLPIMLIPKWVKMHAQPIYVDDTIRYLVAALAINTKTSQIVEIGGADVVNYLDLMKGYARLTGRKRLFIPVPFLTPYLSSVWLGLITPLYARIGRKLIASITVPSVINSTTAQDLFPSISPMSFEDALIAAIEQISAPSTNWSGSLSSSRGKIRGTKLPPVEELLFYRCQREFNSKDNLLAFQPVRQIGGKTGWYFWSYLWYLRGYIDLLLGGIGTRRGRRDPVTIRVGDTIDWWRVEQFEDGKYLLLRAEMKVPGYAWLEFKLDTVSDQCAIWTQTAYYKPSGILGQVYWYLLYPLHVVMFEGMVRRITKTSKRLLKST
ncbi:MAG: SDR family oxidoreductase, partial [bacterium]|nr:SDR family oxidoreductase [bacterium]